MSLYPIVLFVHSWLRWFVLAFLVGAMLRSIYMRRKARPWAEADRSLQLMLTIFVDVQLLVGLILYLGVSPIVPHTVEGYRNAMGLSAIRFFAVEHLVMMLLGVAAVHVASVWTRKASDPLIKHRRWSRGLFLALALILAGIPWANLPYGRPLFRFITMQQG